MNKVGKIVWRSARGRIAIRSCYDMTYSKWLNWCSVIIKQENGCKRKFLENSIVQKINYCVYRIKRK